MSVTTYAGISSDTGGKLSSDDGNLTLAMMQGVLPGNTVNVQIQGVSFQSGDPRASREGQPLAYTYVLTETNSATGQSLSQFDADVVLTWNVDPSVLSAAGIRGWPLHVYGFDAQQGSWVDVPSFWNNDSGQMVATATQLFSTYALGDGFNRVGNYVPTVNNFEMDLQSGAASASYPINLPPGPGGLAPKVSLSYNSGAVDRVDSSQQGPSSVGWGWTLSTSYIAATQHTFYSGSTGYFPWTASIVSDGANGDLIKGGDGFWHTANESFAKVVYNSGADTWEAWDKSGTHYVFDLKARIHDDNNQGSGLVVTNRWMLRTVTDVHNNTITYDYIYEEKGSGAHSTAVPEPTARTRAVYPAHILYGAGGNQVKVDFDVTSENGRTDHSPSDDATEAFQGSYVDRIDVSLRQPDNNYKILRSYNLTQNYVIQLPGLPTRTGAGTPTAVPTTYPHLTLKAITQWGKEEGPGVPRVQLPSTTFDYWGATDVGGCSQSQVLNCGHLEQADNGYGGSVWYYYDAAAADLNQNYRRVRSKRVKDGLMPTATTGLSTAHDALYQYEYRGGALNGTNLSAESIVDAAHPNPLHTSYAEFRGYSWARETDPSGQTTEHYFGQDDLTKAKEYRSQVGQAPVFSSTMDDNPPNGSYWTTVGTITNIVFPPSPTGTPNHVWKVWATATAGVAPFSKQTRNVGVTDGSDVSESFYIAGADSQAGPSFGLTGTWKLTDQNGNYWGLRVARECRYAACNASQPYNYQAYAVWNVGSGEQSRNLSDSNANNPDFELLPHRIGPIKLRTWYTVHLHTSPDGRFVMQLGGGDSSNLDPNSAGLDDQNYVVIKSTDEAFVGGNRTTIPLFPTGHNWTFSQSTGSLSNNDPGYQFLLDNYSETRTLYSQSDSAYSGDVAPVSAAGVVGRPNWQVGENHCDGMKIHLAQVLDSSSTAFGDACCEPGQYKRNATSYAYDSEARDVTKIAEHGDVGIAGDERTTYNAYSQDSSGKHILGRVAWTHLYAGDDVPDNGGPGWNGDTVFYYDYQGSFGQIPPGGNGDLTKTTRFGRKNGQFTNQSTWQQFHYDTYGNQDQVTDADPNHPPTVTRYDSFTHALPDLVTYANGRSEATSYDYTLDLPNAVTDMNGIMSETRYDQFGRPVKSWIDADGLGSSNDPNEEYAFSDFNVANIAPNAANNYMPRFYIAYRVHLGTAAGANPYTWQQRWFDGRGRTLQDVQPKDGSNVILVDTSYNINGQVERATMPYQVGNPNPSSYPTSYIPANWNQPNLYKTYDGLGRPSRIYNADGTFETYYYNWLNWMAVRDELGNYKQLQTVDAYGRLDTAREYDETPGYSNPGVFTKYFYDSLNNLVEVRRDNGGPNQTSTTMQYDGLGRKQSMTDPDMGTWNYEYDAVGNLTGQKDALYLSNPNQYANHYLHIDYDNMNRPVAKYYGDAHHNAGVSMADVRFYYDDDLGDATTTKSWGRLRKAEVTGVDGQGNKANAHKYEYTSRGMLLKEQVTSALSNRTYETSYTYDTGGRLTSTTYPDPDAQHERIDLQYNSQAIGLPYQMTTNKGTVLPVRAAQYNARGQLTSMEQGSLGPSGDVLTTGYTYDDASTKRGWLNRTLVTTGAGATLLDMNLTYTLSGNVSRIQQNAGGTPSNPAFYVDYQYDGQDRLRRATSNRTDNIPLFPEEFYSFDSLDRMTTRRLNDTTYSYGYDPNTRNDRPISYRGNQYSYDANGNQTTSTDTGTGNVQTRVFDPEGRLESIQQGDGFGGSVTSTFIYDANGQRLIKTVNTPVPTSTNTPTNTPTNTATPDPCGPNAVLWQNFLSAEVIPPNKGIYRTGGANWQAGASSTKALSAGYGYMQFEARFSGMGMVAGLSNGDTDGSYSDIDFGIHLQTGTNNVYVHERDAAGQGNSGYSDWIGPLGTYQVGDRFRVEVTQDEQGQKYGTGSIKYYWQHTGSSNWTLFYTSGRIATYPLRVDASLGEAAAGGQPAEVYLPRLYGCNLVDVTPFTPTATACAGPCTGKPGGDPSKPSSGNSGSAAQPNATKSASAQSTNSASSTNAANSTNATTPNSISSVAVGSTIYIGGLYEEDITNRANPSPAYTSYYAFAGKMVGMRRANQGTQNGQLRVVGDHLGSTSLIVDTQNPSQVVQRTYYKPYGEVAWSWTPSGGVGTDSTSLTSVGYTGQRLDGDSGLMYYGARFYDPVLSSFVSADTITPNKTDPKSRNRYSYVVNNPLANVDPSGHMTRRADDPLDVYTPGANDEVSDQCTTRTCTEAELHTELYRYGINIYGPYGLFTIEELTLLLTAIHDLMRAAGWTTYGEFRSAMGVDEHEIWIKKESLNFSGGSANSPKERFASGDTLAVALGAAYADPSDPNRVIIGLDMGAMYELKARTGISFADTLKQTFVHELAHVWDYASGGHFSSSREGIRSYANAGNPNEQGVSGYADVNDAEDWAETVTAMVYPGLYNERYHTANEIRASWRGHYVQDQFDGARRRR